MADRPMRVLFALAELGPGGVESNALNLMSRLDGERFSSRLFLHQAPRFGREVPPGVEVRWAIDGRYRRTKLLPILAACIRQARDCDVIVAAQEGRAALIAFLTARLLRKPIIGCIQFDWQAFRDYSRYRQLLALRWLYPRMTRIVACGEGAGESLRQITGSALPNMQVIRNFVEAKRIREAAQQPMPGWAHQALSKPTVLGLGRLEPQKGFDVLIRAHAKLREHGVDHHLVILGEGSERDRLESLAAELGVADTVFLPGRCENPFPIVRAATVFALSSRFEGMPFALLEAMTLGMPVVATDCPAGPREALDGGRHGTLVPVEDPNALADALRPPLSDQETSNAMARRAAEAASEFADTHAVPKWERLLRLAINTPGYATVSTERDS